MYSVTAIENTTIHVCKQQKIVSGHFLKFTSSLLKLVDNSTHGDDFLLVIIIIILFGTFN